MARGTLKSNFNDRGFTFVAIAGSSDDVFLHITQLRKGEDAQRYVRGAQVELDVASVNMAGGTKAQGRDARLVSAEPTISSPVGRATGRVKFFQVNFGFLIDSKTGEEWYVSSSSVPRGHLRDGDIVEFDCQVASGQQQAVNVQVVDWAKTGDVFADALDMGHPRWAKALADLAEEEGWNYKVNPSKDPHQILRSYFKYTFLRINELPDHVVKSKSGSMAFNTGLVTRFQEQIFAVFLPRTATEKGPSWILHAFEKESSHSFLHEFGGRIPPLARYFDSATQLVYDVALPLKVNVEHVPHDPARFPHALKGLSPTDLAALVNAKAPDAIERVRRNYKTAIPQFYRDGRSGVGKMQLLLPVALLSRDRVELALAVDRLDSGVYLGKTVLTLDWAYNNARLLTRPDSDWLRP